MPLKNLDNLVKVRSLKAEPGAQKEFDGLLKSAKIRLADAQNKGLSFESRFDLTYTQFTRLGGNALARLPP